MLLASLQALLSEFYALDLAYEVDDFLTTDETLARALDSGGRQLDEKLLISEADGEAEVSLYLEQRLLERLERSDPLQRLDAENLEDFWTAFEGVSHFTYYAWNAQLEKSVTLLEMELQAEVEARTAELRAIYEMVNEGERILLDPARSLAELGDLLHQAWVTKRKLDATVSNASIDERYEAARKAGAIGGKLLGAGGGGFLLMFVPPDRKSAVMAAMRGLTYVPLRMERDGTSVVLYNPELTSNYLPALARA